MECEGARGELEGGNSSGNEDESLCCVELSSSAGEDVGTPPRDNTATPREASELQVGDKVAHKVFKYNAVVMALGQDNQESWQHGKICIEYQLKQGQGNKKMRRWVSPRDLEVICNSSTKKRPRQASAPRSRTAVRPSSSSNTTSTISAEDVVGSAPEVAAHERGRKVAQNTHKSMGVGAAWGKLGVHKTSATSVSLFERIRNFPNHSLKEVTTSKGRVLFCIACCKEIENILGTIKTHTSSKKHLERLEKHEKKRKDDVDVKSFVHDYIMQNPEDEGGSLSKEVQLCRWRVVESCMFAGIPFHKIDALRPMLEDRGWIQLTSSTHLKPFIPMIEDYELCTLRSEIEGQRVAAIFDGTTRLGECVAVLLR